MSSFQTEMLSTEILPERMDVDDDVEWFAIQTRARNEKKVNELLQFKGIETFLPLMKEIHRWSDRNQVVNQPLFPGYVFVHIVQRAEFRLSILRTLGVYGFVGDRGVGVPIPEKQIRDIHTVLSNNLNFSPYPFLRIGQRVRVRGGCLDGVEGSLVSINADHSLVISVELLKRSVAVRISGYDFELA
jgi:transcription antitermination factor NusG